MNKNLISFSFVVLFITGCQNNVATPSQSVRSLESINSTGSNSYIENKKIVENGSSGSTNTNSKSLISSKNKTTLTNYERITLGLLDLAEEALAAQKLLTPEDDNANLYFQAALGRDPGNYRATQGIAYIVEIYTDWAWTAAKGRNYQKAEQYLDNARAVNPEDPLINEVTSRIKDLKSQRQRAVQKGNVAVKAKEGRYLLPKTLFSLTEDEIIAEIQPIIDAVSKTKQSLEIFWPNDKEARLIYQIINSRIPDFRVRAMTYPRASYTVELQQD